MKSDVKMTVESQYFYVNLKNAKFKNLNCLHFYSLGSVEYNP